MNALKARLKTKRNLNHQAVLSEEDKKAMEKVLDELTSYIDMSTDYFYQMPISSKQARNIDFMNTLIAQLESQQFTVSPFKMAQRGPSKLRVSWGG